ncbi:MAG: amidase [Myxococcales bacterium]|nr:amidase [Myxococcales bacterium]
MALDPLLALSAVELARRIRDGETSSRQVVEAHIQRLLEVNPDLNAVVVERLDAARGEADAADRAVAEDPRFLPPLHGVPCTIKESFAFKGMPNSAGLVSRKAHRAAEHAPTVARLLDAGAIPLGVTNTSELCMWMESNNRLYGRTNNPYDHDRIVGGSSGGEGAIIGAGASPFGLGSDVGGSIRMPAFFNGVFGHKATGGLVPTTGQFPTAGPDAATFLASGPLCRRAEDLMPLLEILAGPDGQDRACRPMPLGHPERVKIGRLPVLDIRSNGRTRIHPDLMGAQARVVEHLSKLGCRIKGARPRGLEASFDIWAAMFGAAEGRDKFRHLLDDRSIPGVMGQLALWLVGRSPHTLPALILALFENIGFWMPRRTARMIELGRALRAELMAAIGDGVMIYPSFPAPAPRHGMPLFPPLQWVYTAILNVLELPATQVPLGLSADGLPLGVQVVAGPGRDHVCIAVAMELERAFGGWVPPPRWETA